MNFNDRAIGIFRPGWNLILFRNTFVLKSFLGNYDINNNSDHNNNDSNNNDNDNDVENNSYDGSYYDYYNDANFDAGLIKKIFDDDNDNIVTNNYNNDNIN